jgi:hypothetical protein
MSLLTVVLIAAALTGGQDPDAPIVTGGSVRAVETAEALRVREALAYATPLPRGAPEQDYPLVAWCEALVTGHVAVGESLTNADQLDDEIVRLGKLEAADFRDALNIGRGRQTAATLAAAETAAAAARGLWTEVLANPDEAVRSQTFGLFFGLPGRCEHAARRVRDNITAAPATLEDAGLDETGAPAGE